MKTDLGALDRHGRTLENRDSSHVNWWALRERSCGIERDVCPGCMTSSDAREHGSSSMKLASESQRRWWGEQGIECSAGLCMAEQILQPHRPGLL